MTDVRRVDLVLRIGLAAAITVPVLAACRQPPDRTVIALLTSDPPATLADDPGRSAFLDRVAARCASCVVADQYDGATAATARAAVADGADVIVVQALTSDLGEEIVVAAGKVPVVAVDRFVAGSDWFVGYDLSETGTALAEVVAGDLEADAADRRPPVGVLVVEGSTVDADADTDVVVQGLRDALAGHDVEVIAELRATTGTAEETRDWVAAQLERPGGGEIEAVLASTDEQARGVTLAFVRARLRRPWPLVTGAGGDLDAVRRVVGGDQTLTVHMPTTQTAERAADVALSLASATPGEDLVDATEVEGVPAYVFEPMLVSVTNVTDTVVRDGTFTPEDICVDDLVAACARLGIR